ncbi:catenin beta 1 [Paragonimus westermani]|uniref:Catenin beta 1 n=1 Tax=Paragonimus westermani TaxID=34504 RepID=A0A5J4NL52_9TREM|nr:catenin beta 1 [Paragonimus westermani]
MMSSSVSRSKEWQSRLNQKDALQASTFPNSGRPVNSCDADVSNVQFIDNLMGPITRLDRIFQDIIDYKFDANSAAANAPKFAKMLQSDLRTDAQLKIVLSIHSLARNQASRLGLVTCPELIRELTKILQTTRSTDLQIQTALTLQLLAKTRAGAEMLREELTIPILVKMLKHPTDIIYTTALYILNQIMWQLPDETRPEVRGCSGQINLADLFQEGKMTDPNWIIICADTLRMTVYRDSETKLSLLDTNIHNDLVRLVRTYSNHLKVAYNLARLIKVLGTCNENKTKFVDCGAVEALSPLLQSTNEILQLETLWSLRNLSDHAFHLTTTKNLVISLIDLLTSTDENVSICAAGCLCNLTCKNSTNKGLVIETGGVTRLCQLLNLNSQRQEITEPICSALRHVTHRSPNVDAAIYEIRSNQTLPVIVQLLQNNDDSSALPLIKSAVGLVRNLATDEESRVELKSLGTARSLARILKQTHNTAKTEQNALDDLADRNMQEVTLGCIEGVHLEEMFELCLAALQLMTKDSQVHNELLHTAGLLTTVVQLLYSPSESVQRASVAFLSQLAASRAGAKAIEQEGACPRLTEMIQSNNEYIAAYSAAVLHRITRDKPDEYRRRLSLELRQSLFDGGLLVEPQAADPHDASDLWTPGPKERTSRSYSPRPDSIHSAKLRSARR